MSRFLSLQSNTYPAITGAAVVVVGAPVVVVGAPVVVVGAPVVVVGALVVVVGARVRVRVFSQVVVINRPIRSIVQFPHFCLP